jgi:hypothetical protein
MDAHIPKTITNGLRLRNVDVITAQEDNSDKVKDLELIAKAGEPQDLANKVEFLPL